MESRTINVVIFGILVLGIFGFSQSASAAVYDGTKAGVMLTFEHTSTTQLDAIDENSLRNDMVGTLGPLSARVGNSGLMTQQEMLDLQSIGWEIASHSATHEQIDDSTPESVLIADIVQSKTDLENMGFQVKGYIPPYNTITLASFEFIKNNYEWTSFWGPIQPDPREMTLQTLEDSFDTHGMYHLYAWGVGNVYSMNTADAVKTKIDEAIANNYLIGFKFHKIEDGDFPTSTSPAIFTEIIDYLREQRDLGNLDILTRSQGYGSFGPDTTEPITTANPPGAQYFSVQQITLTANEPSTIYYTTDGSTPTTSSNVFSTPIPLSTNTTLKFFAIDNFGNEESVKTEVYLITIDPDAPITIANPLGGSYFFTQQVALTANEPATIYYTTNGFDPTTLSPEYSTEIPISTITTLKFFGKDIAGNEEFVNTELYIITADTEKPVIFTLGPSKTIPYGSTYSEFGAEVDDNDPAYSGTVTIGGDTVDPFTPGDYIITYNAPADASGNTPDEKTITITVDIETDTEKPVITPNGVSHTIPYGSTYTELGGTVTDNDPDYAEMVTVGGDFVNPFIPGDYMKTYNAPADASGNIPDEKTITITVEAQLLYPICTALPDNGTWMITASCTLDDSFFAPGNVEVKSDSVLVIQNGVVLIIPQGFNITIFSGSGVLLEDGGGLEVRGLT